MLSIELVVYCYHSHLNYFDPSPQVVSSILTIEASKEKKKKTLPAYVEE